MVIVDFTLASAEPIALFESIAASSVSLGLGEGEVHVYCLHFGFGGVVGPHPTGFCQLFLVIQGEGWAAGDDERRVPLAVGQGLFFEAGEMHSNRSDAGMMAIMVQASRLRPPGID